MGQFVCVHSKDEVERFARQNPFLHLYTIGDLDDFFWPHTVWYALRTDGEVRQIVLVYTDSTMPAVLALCEPPVGAMRELLDNLTPFLPRRFHAHITKGVADVLSKDYRVQSHGLFHKMGLTDRSRLASVDVAETIALGEMDRPDLQAMYAASYPGNWFVPRMLETGCYFGVRRGGRIVCVAGVHVFSPGYKVAALGNIATAPSVRGQGLATQVTGRLCQHLAEMGIESIGLNVRADNHSAVACYRKLGFERIADYGEFTLELKS